MSGGGHLFDCPRDSLRWRIKVVGRAVVPPAAVPSTHRSGRCRIIGASRRLDHSIGPSRHVPLPVLTGPSGSRPPPPRAAPFNPAFRVAPSGSDPAPVRDGGPPTARTGGSDPRARPCWLL